MTIRVISTHALLLLACQGSWASAQTAGSAMATRDAAASGPVAVTATSDPLNRVGNPVFVNITLRNTASQSQLVKNMTVKVDPSATSRMNTALECPLRGMGELTLGAGESYAQTCRFPVAAQGVRPAAQASSGAATSALEDSHAPWYSPLFSEDVRLMVEVDVEGVGVHRFYPAISVKAVEASIFVGGVAGAILLALFVLAERILKNPEVRESWLKNLMVALLMGLRGGVMAVIALLVGRTTQGAGSPVVLTVTDFAGGMLVGLFSYPLATWISSTLKLDGVFVNTAKDKPVTSDDRTGSRAADPRAQISSGQAD